MGNPSSGQPLPEDVRAELYGEDVVFVVQEPRLIPYSGKVGAIVLGIVLLLVSAATYTLREDGDLRGLVFSALAGVAGIVLLVGSPILYARPGALVVGTPTRLIRQGRWNVKWARWQDVASVDVEEDGSIRMKPLPGERALPSSLLLIVQAPDAAALAATIRGLIPAASTAAPADAARSRVFTATHHVPPGTPPESRLIGIALASVGAIASIFFAGILLNGGTVEMSVNDGPPRDVGASDPVAWVPVGIGLVFMAAGIFIFRRGSPKPGRVAYEFTATGLLERREGSAGAREQSWGTFRGHYKRSRTPRGDEFRIAIVGPSTRNRRSSSALWIIGVADADAFEAELRRHLAK